MLLLPNRRGLWGADWCREPLWRRAGAKPSWHIAPVRTGTVTDLISGSQIITFTNSSPAWGFNSSGVLVQPTANVPFIEYDPATGACLGWRVWDAVVNLVRQSGAISLSTPWFSFATAPSVTTNAIAAPDNTTTATRVTFAAADSRVIHVLNTALARNTTYTVSVFARPVTAGTLNKIRLAAFDGAGQFNSNDITLSSGWQRISFTFTTSTTTSSLDQNIQLRNESSASVANDVYLWGAQLNLGPLAPYVPTGALTASSTADVASITGAAFAGIWNPAEATVYAEATFTNTTSFNTVYTLGDNTSSNQTRTIQWNDGTNRLLSVVVGGALQVAITRSGGIGTFKFAAGLKADDYAVSQNGAAVATDTSGLMAVADRLLIGATDGSRFYLNGYIRDMAILKSRRPNANLQAMTQ